MKHLKRNETERKRVFNWDFLFPTHRIPLKFLPGVSSFSMASEKTPDSSKHEKKNSLLKILLPIRCEKPQNNQIPFYDVGLFSFISLSWMTKKIFEVYKKGGENVDWWQCSEPESTQYNVERIEEMWDKEYKEKGDKASLVRVVRQYNCNKLILGTVLFIISLVFKMLTPFYLVPMTLDFLKNDRNNYKYGIILAASIFVAEILRLVFFVLMWLVNYQAGMSVKVALNSLFFKKVLSVKSLKNKNIGELVNLFTADSERVSDSAKLNTFIIGSPIIVLAAIIYNYYLLGPLSLIGSFVFIGFYPTLILVNKFGMEYRRKAVKLTDRRINITNEIINYIRLIKMYAWEDSFIAKIKAIRLKEKKLLEICGFVQAVNSCLPQLAPILGTVLTFLVYVLTKHDLTIIKAFTMVTVLNSLHFALNSLPYAFKSLADAIVGIKRYQDLLLLETIESNPSDTLQDQEMVVFDKVTLNWNVTDSSALGNEVTFSKIDDKLSGNGVTKAEETFSLMDSTQQTTLKDISFTLQKGEMIGVCGSTGSGKSSLLSAILGRMNMVSGNIASRGTIAYVPQQPWIINGTIQYNILLGLPFQEHRYKKIINICSLEEDFYDFPHEDLTEVNIATSRALYNDSDIYLLDDPLSAVDAHIGKRIYDECFNMFLCTKAVLFVTHQLQYLTSCDHILFLKEGQITERGTHQQLVDANQDYANLIDTFFTESSTEAVRVQQPSFLQRGMSTMSTISQYSCVPEDFELVAKEDISKNTSFEQLGMYVKACGGVVQCLFVLLLFIISVSIQVLSMWWLTFILKEHNPTSSNNITNPTILSDNTTDLNSSTKNATYSNSSTKSEGESNLIFNASIYGGIGLLMVLFHMIRGVSYVKTVLKGSTRLHEQMLQHIINMPMSFFDSTPTGRIINRFSSDILELDNRLPLSGEITLLGIVLLLAVIISLIIIAPHVTVAFILLLIIFVVISWTFTRSVLEIKKLDNTSRSPLISLITTSLYGLTSLFAYRKNNVFFSWFSDLHDKHTSFSFLFYLSDRWIAVRLEFIANLILFAFIISVVFIKEISAEFAGLGLVFAVQFIGMCYFVIRLLIDAAARFDSVKRVAEYIKVGEELQSFEIEPTTNVSPNWMDIGHIMFEDYSMRYRSDLPNTLKKIHLQVLPGQKLGIAGRSGSGKSSLGLALFRMVAPSSGTISIGGQDITEVSLKELRSRISIIPQDPVLFIGTIRYNLDPFNNYTDEQIWSALENCYMKNAITALKNGLDSDVEEDGKNFSVGQRQLLCLARVLLRANKILVLDEATSSVDAETDSLIQNTIKQCFTNCTIMIIAHRLNTIVECDKVIIMDNGKVVEEGIPNELLQKSNSKFYKLWKAREIM
ncbi:ATP-binding cassette sub-family C member 5 [Octopus bimaculoides]|nr:ATP-binding cassette sub-family C member 5 [Octopus bimaculoides]